MEEQTLNKFISKLDSNQRRLAFLVIAFFDGKMRNPDKIDNQTQNIIESFVRIPTDKMASSIPYDFVTILIFEYKYQLSDFDADEILLKILLKETDDPLKHNSIERCLEKLMRHIRLAMFQYDYITRGIEKTESALENANKKIKELSESTQDSLETVKQTTELSEEALEEARTTASTVEQNKTKIYSEFIGILGIFTAVAFMSMGSLELLNNLFSDISNPTSRVLAYILEAGGVYLLVLYLLMISLFVGMKKVIGNGEEYIINDNLFKIILSISIFFIVIGFIFSSGIVY